MIKLVSVVDDMRQHYHDYQKSLELHLGAIVKYELKKILDEKVGELGLYGDDEKEEQLIPVSKFQVGLDEMK